MNNEKRPVWVTVESKVDGISNIQEAEGKYTFRSGAHLVTYTDDTDGAITKHGMKIREDQFLLHRTGAFEGKMIFDPHEVTVFSYRALPLVTEFILHTDGYELSVSEEGLAISLDYRLFNRGGGPDPITGKQHITIRFI